MVTIIKRLNRVIPEEQKPDSDSSLLEKKRVFIGYGPAYSWFDIDPSKFAQLLKSYKVEGTVLEFFGHHEWSEIKQYKKRLQWVEDFLKALGDGQLVVNILLVNSNCGLGKYGSKSPASIEFKREIEDSLHTLAALTREHSNLFITPVNEGGANKKSEQYERLLQALAKKLIARNQLVNNWGARPKDTDGMGYLAWHPEGMSKDLGPSGSWIVTDHGTLLVELQGAHGKHPFDRNRLKEYARKVLLTGHPLLLYHWYEPIDMVTLETIAEIADGNWLI